MAEEQDEGFTLPTKCDCIAMETGAVVKDLQASLFPVFAKGSYLSSFLQNTLKSNQVEINTDSRTLRPIAKLKEPRDLFALPKELDCPQQAARWPSECQVLEDRVHHIDYIPPVPEQYYRPSGREVQPKPIGEEQGEVVFQYYPMSAVNYFSRSSVGGSKYFVDASPSDNPEDLRFESRFESGNLAKVVKITESYYELYLRTDLYTNKHMQWFYFRVENARTNVKYRFSIVNLSKDESLYNEGMRPLLYSTKDARLNNVGWRRCGDNITYYKNDNQNGEEDQSPSFTLTFNVEFPYDNDLVYLAHCYPYTYTDLQDYLIRLQNNPLKSSYCKLRLLCRSLAGNNVYFLTITAPSNGEEPKKKRAIVITARVHPGETPSSWMMKGFIDFLTGESEQAKELREKFIFKLVPMLNPDGVIVGNNRCSLTGRDLNRQYRTVIRETYPSVWHTKLMIRRLMEECGVEMYCDLHAHSRKHNVFIYGCENKRIGDKRLQEQVFPLMLHKNAADKFSFENCKFRIQRSKEGTGRVVVWMMGVANSYTMEASFGGSLLGSRCNTHFHTQDYEQMGRYFCETLLDYCDQEPSKERLRTKIMNRLLQEGSNADEPTNIVLSDYSSDEGDTSSSSEEERVEKRLAELECCSPVPAPPPSPVLPRREHRLFKESVVERSPPPPRRILQVHRTTIDLATTDLSSDLCEPPTEVESGDDSLSWRQANKKNKSDSPVRNAWKYPDKSSEKCDMPPELIVTPAQVYETQIATELSEKLEVSTVPAIKEETPPVHPPVPNPTAELQPVDKLRTHMWHQMRCPPVTRLQSRTVDEMTAELQGKVGSSLRQKLWTGIPCSCHISTTETYWSKGIWATSNESLLRSCSQKLSILQQSYTQNQSRSEAKALRKKLSRLRKYASETMGKYAGRTKHNSESDTSPADEVDTEASESRKRLKKKPKYRNSHTARSLPSKQDDFNTSRSEKLSSQRYSLSSASGNKSQQQQKPPSLKWKFRKGGLVATAAATINSRKMDHFESASDTETNDKQKNSGKKKKKRKCSTAKKTKRVSSASKQSPKKAAKANLSW